MRGKRRPGPDARRQRKDRVLQARIPSQLDEQLRERAEQLGLSVSTLVRNVLLHTFDLVEGAVSDSAEIARVFQHREGRPPRKAAEKGSADDGDVLAWHEAILNRNSLCRQCNAILPRGSRAAIGLLTRGQPPLLCLSCLAEISDDEGGTA